MADAKKVKSTTSSSLSSGIPSLKSLSSKTVISKPNSSVKNPSETSTNNPNPVNNSTVSGSPNLSGRGASGSVSSIPKLNVKANQPQSQAHTSASSSLPSKSSNTNTSTSSTATSNVSARKSLAPSTGSAHGVAAKPKTSTVGTTHANTTTTVNTSRASTSGANGVSKPTTSSSSSVRSKSNSVSSSGAPHPVPSQTLRKPLVHDNKSTLKKGVASSGPSGIRPRSNTSSLSNNTAPHHPTANKKENSEHSSQPLAKSQPQPLHSNSTKLSVTNNEASINDSGSGLGLTSNITLNESDESSAQNLNSSPQESESLSAQLDPQGYPQENNNTQNDPEADSNDHNHNHNHNDHTEEVGVDVNAISDMNFDLDGDDLNISNTNGGDPNDSGEAHQNLNGQEEIVGDVDLSLNDSDFQTTTAQSDDNQVQVDNSDQSLIQTSLDQNSSTNDNSIQDLNDTPVITDPPANEPEREKEQEQVIASTQEEVIQPSIVSAPSEDKAPSNSSPPASAPADLNTLGDNLKSSETNEKSSEPLLESNNDVPDQTVQASIPHVAPVEAESNKLDNPIVLDTQPATVDKDHDKAQDLDSSNNTTDEQKPDQIDQNPPNGVVPSKELNEKGSSSPPIQNSDFPEDEAPLLPVDDLTMMAEGKLPIVQVDAAAQQALAVRQLKDLEMNRRTNEDGLKRLKITQEEERLKKLEEERKQRVENEKIKREEIRKKKEIEERKRAEEEERIRLMEAARKKKENDQREAFKHGIIFLKIPHGSGGPRETRIFISDSRENIDWVIGWDSKKKKDEDTEWDIHQCDLAFGHLGGQFKINKKLREKYPANRCLSIAGPTRGLDLVALNENDYNIALNVLANLPFASLSLIESQNHNVNTADTP